MGMVHVRDGNVDKRELLKRALRPGQRGRWQGCAGQVKGRERGKTREMVSFIEARSVEVANDLWEQINSALRGRAIFALMTPLA